MIVLRIIIDILLVLGIFFVLAGVMGMIRMPDTFCRIQSSTNIATMGAVPIALACSICGFIDNNNQLGIKSLVIVFFLIITNPVASNAMAKAAYKTKAELSKETKCDYLRRDKSNE